MTPAQSSENDHANRGTLFRGTCSGNTPPSNRAATRMDARCSMEHGIGKLSLFRVFPPLRVEHGNNGTRAPRRQHVIRPSYQPCRWRPDMAPTGPEASS
jgi:hypothetical protein